MIEQEVLDALPLQQKLKFCKQLRQEQVNRYNEWSSEDGKGLYDNKKQQRKNSKGAVVDFEPGFKLWDAITSYDDRDVFSQLEDCDGHVNLTIPNCRDLTLLHKCCLEDNLQGAEILISRHIEVNALDDDQWTPLHYAAALDHGDIVQLLLANGAEATTMDIDGNFPMDHAPTGSYSHKLLLEHLQNSGIDMSSLKDMRMEKPKEMLSDVQKLLDNFGDINQTTEAGTTLLHIACANGYREVAKLLLNNKAKVTVKDKSGWTPLHSAARFAQYGIVKLLIKHSADPNLPDYFGRSPADIAGTGKIQRYLLAHGRSYEAVQQLAASDREEEEYDDVANVSHASSKSLRINRLPIAKKEALIEGGIRRGTLERGTFYKFRRSEGLFDDTVLVSCVDDDEENEEEAMDELYVNLNFTVGATRSASVSSEPRTPDEELPPSVVYGDNTTDDLTTLPQINEEILLKTLENRYMQNIIYTYVGDILIAVNPFKELPLYSKEITQQYHNNESNSLPPHIYGVAEKISKSLLREQRPQCCVISGESGAGKTESCKYMIQHILAIAQSEENNLNVKIQQVNPLLEAFGNAQTMMNNNSSRFGKYLELHLSEDGYVQGAKIHEYLLEKSRVIYQGEGERNFHIFYLMFAGLSPDEFQKYGLESVEKHRYLQTPGVNLKNVITPDTQEQFLQLAACLKFIGFTTDDLNNLWQILSAVLHIGDIEFIAVGNNDSAQISNIDILKKVAGMLQVPFDELGSALVADVSITRGEQIRKERTVAQATDCRDALAKALYGRLFSWIVNSINHLIQPVNNSCHTIEIGILDIFGFENFPKNSFEQLCINITNEQLQNYFNEHIFKLERDDCEAEGIPHTDVVFENNQPILDMFLGKPLGILAILDEESKFPKGTDQTCARKLHVGPGAANQSLYVVPKDGGMVFSIMHYAGKVVYDMDGVLDKNRDTLPQSVIFTLKTSDNLLIKDMFQTKITRTGSIAPSCRQQRTRRVSLKAPSNRDIYNKRRSQLRAEGGFRNRKEAPNVTTERKGPATVAFHFKNSLAELMNKMKAASPHFVRCIKPNLGQNSDEFDSKYVLTQLRYTGIGETIRIRKQGYAMRISFTDFTERYAAVCLCGVPHNNDGTSLDVCKVALQNCASIEGAGKFKDYKIGKTKLFFKYWHLQILDECCKKLEQKVIVAQAALRGWLERHNYQRRLEDKREQEEHAAKFLNKIDTLGNSVYANQVASQRFSVLEDDEDEDAEDYDDTRTESTTTGDQEVEWNEEIRKSIEALDQAIDSYDGEDSGIGSQGGSDESFPPGLRGYRTNMQHGRQGNDFPPPPPDLLQQQKELYQRNKRPPPQVPRRDPQTRLSTSTSSESYQSQLSYESEQGGAGYPVADYDSDRGPESGYQTPEQRSELDYPTQHQKGSWSRSQLNQQVPAGAGPGGLSGGTAQRQSHASQGSIPQYPAPSHPGGYNTQGYHTQGYAPQGLPQEENVYDTQLPPRMPQSRSHQAFSNTLTHAPPMSPHMSHSTSATMSPQMSMRQDNTCAAGAPENFYDRTLPAPVNNQHVPTSSSRNGDQGIQAIRRDSIHATYATQPRQQQMQTAVPAPGCVPPPPVMGGVPPPPPCGTMPAAPPMAGVPPPPPIGESFPPPPPQFNNAPDSPTRAPPGPPTMPKSFKKGARPGPVAAQDAQQKDHSLPFPVRLKQVDSPIKKESLAGQGINKGQVSGQAIGQNEPITPPLQKIVPPPAPPLSTLPKNLGAQGTPPPPPPLSTMPKHPPGSEPVPPPPPPGPASPPMSPPPPPPPNAGIVPPPPPAFFGDDQLPPPPPPFPGGGAQSLESQIRNISLHGSDGYEQFETDQQPRFFPDVPPDFAISSPDSCYDDAASIVSGTSGASNSSSGSQACSPKLNSPQSIRRLESTMPTNKQYSDIDIDVSKLPGFQPIPDNCPGWKKAMLEKKNAQLLQDAKDKVSQQRAEEERWRDVPEWKRKLICDKEKKRGEEMAPLEAERRRHEEEMARLQALPEWKRNLIMKKRVGDIN